MKAITDLENRKFVWLAMSDLFLDSDVTTSYDYIARTCAASTYSMDELYKILKNEVTPACAANLMSIAGEWAGFNQQWLEQRISNAISNKNMVGRYFYSFSTNFVIGKNIDAHWAKISTKITLLRGIV